MSRLRYLTEKGSKLYNFHDNKDRIFIKLDKYEIPKKKEFYLSGVDQKVYQSCNNLTNLFWICKEIEIVSEELHKNGLILITKVNFI